MTTFVGLRERKIVFPKSPWGASNQLMQCQQWFGRSCQTIHKRILDNPVEPTNHSDTKNWSDSNSKILKIFWVTTRKIGQSKFTYLLNLMITPWLCVLLAHHRQVFVNCWWRNADLLGSWLIPTRDGKVNQGPAGSSAANKHTTSAERHILAIVEEKLDLSSLKRRFSHLSRPIKDIIRLKGVKALLGQQSISSIWRFSYKNGVVRTPWAFKFV